jgi:hypothetical protein
MLVLLGSRAFCNGFDTSVDLQECDRQDAVGFNTIAASGEEGIASGEEGIASGQKAGGVHCCASTVALSQQGELVLCVYLS